MDDLEEARRLMATVADQALRAGPIDATTVLHMAKVWAHIALAEAVREQTIELRRIAQALEAKIAT
jgi:hypothetical protein